MSSRAFIDGYPHCMGRTLRVRCDARPIALARSRLGGSGCVGRTEGIGHHPTGRSSVADRLQLRPPPVDRDRFMLWPVAVVAEATPPALIIDLTEVPFLASVAMTALVEAHRRVDEASTRRRRGVEVRCGGRGPHDESADDVDGARRNLPAAHRPRCRPGRVLVLTALSS